MKRSFGGRAALWCACLIAACGKDAGCGAQRSSQASVPDRSVILAVLPGGDASPAPAAAASGVHTAATGELEFTFAERGGGVAFVEEKGEAARVVYNATPGKTYDAVGSVVLSPDGRHVAYRALAAGKWRLVLDGREGRLFDGIEMPTFDPEGVHVAYQAMDGERWCLVVDSSVSSGTATRYLSHAFAAGSRIVYLDDANDQDQGRLVVSDLEFKSQTVIAASAFGLVLDSTRTRAAAIVAEPGGQRVVSVALDRPSEVKRGPAYDAVFDVTFGPGGTSIAYVAERSGTTFLVLDDREAALPKGGMIVGPLAIRPGGAGLAALVAVDGPVRFQEFFGAAARAEPAYEEAEGLALHADGRSHAYSASRAGKQFVVIDGKEGPPFDRVVSPLFSPDGRFVVYRARQDGRRFVVVADREGKTVRQHPAYDQVYPVRFTADGRSAAYGVKDGATLAWKVEAL